FGLVFYVLGHRAEYTTFAWMTWEVSRNPLSLAYLGLAQGVPLVLFQLCGGVLADRINRLRLLVATQTLVSLVLGTPFLLTRLGPRAPPHLVRLAAAGAPPRPRRAEQRLPRLRRAEPHGARAAARRPRSSSQRHRPRLHSLAGWAHGRPLRYRYSHRRPRGRR